MDEDERIRQEAAKRRNQLEQERLRRVEAEASARRAEAERQALRLQAEREREGLIEQNHELIAAFYRWARTRRVPYTHDNWWVKYWIVARRKVSLPYSYYTNSYDPSSEIWTTHIEHFGLALMSSGNLREVTLPGLVRRRCLVDLTKYTYDDIIAGIADISARTGIDWR